MLYRILNNINELFVHGYLKVHCLFCILIASFPSGLFVTSYVGYLRNICYLNYENLPNVGTFHCVNQILKCHLPSYYLSTSQEILYVLETFGLMGVGRHFPSVNFLLKVLATYLSLFFPDTAVSLYLFSRKCLPKTQV